MIKKIKKLPNLQFKNYVAVKIKSLYLSYGSQYDFCQFYAQTQNNETLAVIVKFYHSASVFVINSNNLEELYGFLQSICVNEVTSNIELNLNTKKSVFEQLLFLNNKKTGSEISNNLSFEDYNQAYNHFKNDKSGNISVGSFNDWYVDLSHRIRHNSAKLICSSEFAAVCITDSENLIINGIVVNAKNKGIGTELITQIKNESIENSIFVACSQSTQQFYLKNNFKNIGKVYVYGE